MYSPHLALSETYPPKPMARPSNGHTNKNIDMAGPRRSSKSKSPAAASSEKGERARGKDRAVEKERMRSSSSTRSVDLGIEEDLVNMVEIFTLTMFIPFRLGINWAAE
jgi:hypothetical protein